MICLRATNDCTVLHIAVSGEREITHTNNALLPSCAGFGMLPTVIKARRDARYTIHIEDLQDIQGNAAVNTAILKKKSKYVEHILTLKEGRRRSLKQINLQDDNEQGWRRIINKDGYSTCN